MSAPEETVANIEKDTGVDMSAPEETASNSEKEIGVDLQVVQGELVEDVTTSAGGATTAVVQDKAVETPKKLISLLCLVSSLEGADMVLLPCVLFALQQDLGLSLNDLAMMSMVQALAGNFAAPMWGVFADRGTLRRKTIIVMGCILQGLITMILAGVDGFALMLVLRAFNGAMLASLKPIASGIIADVTTETNRGKVYSTMGMSLNIGMMLGSFVGTNLGRKTILGLQGWRISFLIIGGASVLVGAIAATLMDEPPKVFAEKKEGNGWAVVKQEFKEVGSYFKLPSFCVLILQGCFGVIPWNALGYKTLFFQLGGITDMQASLIDVASQIAGTFGNLLGGVIGDRLSQYSRYHGRPFTAQFSVLAGIPVAWFIFMVSPPESAFLYYLLLMVVLGLTATWCGVAVNLPILAEIVKDDRRATIMAWEGTLESTCSAVLGNAMVGILAQNVFGYDLNNAKSDASGKDPTKTKALGSALMLVSFVPWILCFFSYTLLHWSYKKDLAFVRGEDASAPTKEELDKAGETKDVDTISTKATKANPMRLGISAAAAKAAAQRDRE